MGLVLTGAPMGKKLKTTSSGMVGTGDHARHITWFTSENYIKPPQFQTFLNPTPPETYRYAYTINILLQESPGCLASVVKSL